MSLLLGSKSNEFWWLNFDGFLIKKENSNKKFKISLNYIKNVKKEVLIIYGTTNATANDIID